MLKKPGAEKTGQKTTPSHDYARGKSASLGGLSAGRGKLGGWGVSGVPLQIADIVTMSPSCQWGIGPLSSRKNR